MSHPDLSGEGGDIRCAILRNFTLPQNYHYIACKFQRSDDGGMPRRASGPDGCVDLVGQWGCRGGRSGCAEIWDVNVSDFI